MCDQNCHEPCVDPCVETPCVDCNQTPCVNCEDSYEARCVFITEKLICVNGEYFLAPNIDIQEAFKQLICKINELDTKIKFIQENCCPDIFCELPEILGASEI